MGCAKATLEFWRLSAKEVHRSIIFAGLSVERGLILPAFQPSAECVFFAGDISPAFRLSSELYFASLLVERRRRDT